MLSWRGAIVGSAGVGKFLILLLLDEFGRPGASSETALDQQVMQVNQRRYRHMRRAPISVLAQATESNIHAAEAAMLAGDAYGASRLRWP